MSLAARTREAVRESPYLLTALRAGVVNYAAAARRLDVSDDEEAVATALRRFEATLTPIEPDARDVRVTMHRGVGRIDPDDPAGSEALVTVGDASYGGVDGDLTAVVARGAVDSTALAHVLGRCRAAEVQVDAAGVAGDTLVVVVTARDGPDCIRQVEAGLAAVPN